MPYSVASINLDSCKANAIAFLLVVAISLIKTTVRTMLRLIASSFTTHFHSIQSYFLRFSLFIGLYCLVVHDGLSFATVSTVSPGSFYLNTMPQ